MKFRLIERVGLLKETSRYVRNEVKLAISNQKYDPRIEMRGQTALKRYLCVNNGLGAGNNSDICVHHIDFDHDNYDASNICLLKISDHQLLHTKLLSHVIEVWLNKHNIDNKQRRELTKDNLPDQMLEGITRAYQLALDIFVNKNRLDK